MTTLEYYKNIASEMNNPGIQAWKQAGNRVVGITCSNIPEEVIFAAGILPLRLRAPGIMESGMADSHLYRINCTYTRFVLEYLLQGKYDFLDGVVATNTCDHHLRLAGELEDKSTLPFYHYFQMYHTLTDGAREWLIQEMKNLIASIESSFGVTITEHDLRQAISVYNRTRRLLARVNDLRKKDPPAVSGAEYMQIVLTGMSTPREQFNDRLEKLLPQLETRQNGGAGRPRLFIMGGACDSTGFIDFVESKGATIVADGLCFGLRHWQGQVDEDAEDPLAAIANRYLNRVPCPSIMGGFDRGYPLIQGIIKDWHVQGVVSARLKFCDHWAGGRQMLKQALQEDNLVPLLDLEREYGTTESGQISTRIQAFLEMVNR
jgi:benzoyl-CoA reductase/2-hydroxyglutaryl-CoA dehydratase subunit BcrC/BadD/HgdB